MGAGRVIHSIHGAAESSVIRPGSMRTHQKLINISACGEVPMDVNILSGKAGSLWLLGFADTEFSRR